MQQLRSRLGRIRASRTALATTLLLGATLALSGCGAVQEAGAAAVVDGTVVSDQDVQTVSRQVSAVSPDADKVTPTDALLGLILAPFVLAEAERVQKAVSAADARKAVADLADPSPATIEYKRTTEALKQLDQASAQSILKELGKARITVNPRYGTFVAKPPFFIRNPPNWLKPSATQQPSATPPAN